MYRRLTHHVHGSHLLAEQSLFELVLVAFLPQLGQLLVGRFHLLHEGLVALLKVLGSMREKEGLAQDYKIFIIIELSFYLLLLLGYEFILFD